MVSFGPEQFANNFNHSQTVNESHRDSQSLYTRGLGCTDVKNLILKQAIKIRLWKSPLANFFSMWRNHIEDFLERLRQPFHKFGILSNKTSLGEPCFPPFFPHSPLFSLPFAPYLAWDSAEKRIIFNLD